MTIRTSSVFVASTVLVILATAPIASTETRELSPETAGAPATLGRYWGTEFLKSTGNSCPSAYTQYPNTPTQAYDDTQVLLTSQLLATVPARAILEDQTTRTTDYRLLRLPNNSRLGGFSAPTQSADFYRIHYRSTNVFGDPTILSGLVSLPSESAEGGIVVYTHATQISQGAGAPSKPSSEACIVLTAFAGKNRIVAMPDYLGFGANNDIHPYALGSANAPAGLDVITAARELAQQIHPEQTPGSDLFITGYSEGGGNALWLGRVMEETGDPAFKPTLIAPMSGNYDMTGATAQSLVATQPLNTVTLAAKPLLLAFTAQAAWEAKDLEPTSLIQEGLADWDDRNPLPFTAAGVTEIARIMASLYEASAALGYPTITRNPSVLMQPALVSDIQTRNLANPAVALWASNDNLDWTPQTPVYATGILQDQIVPFASATYPVPRGYIAGKPFFPAGNTQNLIASMRAQGLGRDRVAWFGLDGAYFQLVSGDLQRKALNHLNGLVPVLVLAARAIETNGFQDLPQLPDP